MRDIRALSALMQDAVSAQQVRPPQHGGGFQQGGGDDDNTPLSLVDADLVTIMLRNEHCRCTLNPDLVELVMQVCT